jgi:hypothetical protein
MSLRQLLNVIFITISILTFVACNREEEDVPGFFKFTANGAEYNFDKNVGCYVNSISNPNLLLMRGDFNGDNGATGSISNFNGPGTYQIDSTLSNQIAFKIAGLDYYMGGLIQPKSRGQVVINQSRNDGSFTYYTATFSGVAYYSPTDSLVVVNGSIQDESF